MEQVGYQLQDLIGITTADAEAIALELVLSLDNSMAPF